MIVIPVSIPKQISIFMFASINVKNPTDSTHVVTNMALPDVKRVFLIASSAS